MLASADTARQPVGHDYKRQSHDGLEQSGCRGLVLLGKSSTRWGLEKELSLPVVSTSSTVEMLSTPALKQTVWQELQPLISSI